MFKTSIWARALRVDRRMDDFGAPSDAHFVVCSLLVLGPKYRVLPFQRFWSTEMLETTNAWMRIGWKTVGRSGRTNHR
jgi:hypothetical protein